MRDDVTRAGDPSRTHRSAALVWRHLIAVCTGYFMVILGVTILSVAAPFGRDLSISLTDLQWIVDGYTVAFAGLLLLGGALGDRWGTAVFYLGVGVFRPRSAACWHRTRRSSP